MLLKVSRGLSYPAYIPIREIEERAPPPLEPGSNFLEQLAFLEGLESQFREPPGESRFEKMCSTLFQLDVRQRPRRHRRPVVVAGEFEVAYSAWEEEAVVRSEALPMRLSQGVYNFSRIHEHTKRGRLGFQAPAPETRKKYTSVVGAFLLFSRTAEEEWASQEAFTDCWVDFLSTPTVAIEKSRIVNLGQFIEDQLNCNTSMHTHFFFLVQAHNSVWNG